MQDATGGDLTREGEIEGTNQIDGFSGKVVLCETL
jgi:hypothetical protein